jgi:hypothetical protein
VPKYLDLVDKIRVLVKYNGSYISYTHFKRKHTMKKLLLGLAGIIAMGSSVAFLRPLTLKEKFTLTYLYNQHRLVPENFTLNRARIDALLFTVLEHGTTQHGDPRTRVEYMKHNGIEGFNSQAAETLARAYDMMLHGKK